MRVIIELPESATPRTHIAARVAAEYVAHAIGKLDPTAWPQLMHDGQLQGQVAAEFVGIVKWFVIADQ